METYLVILKAPLDCNFEKQGIRYSPFPFEAQGGEVLKPFNLQPRLQLYGGVCVCVCAPNIIIDQN